MKCAHFLTISFLLHSTIFFGAQEPGVQKKITPPTPTPAPVPASPDISKLNVEAYHKRAEGLVRVKPDLTLQDLGIVLSAFGIPRGPLDQIDTIGIKEPQIKGAPTGFEGISIIGKVVFSGTQVNLTVIVAKKKDGSTGVSVSLELPPGWKLSNFSPALAKLDSLSLPSGRFIISNFEYQTPELPGIILKEGLNFVSGIDLTGPFSVIGTLIKNKTKFKDALILEGGQFLFAGHIPKIVADSSFAAIIPFKIGVDFTQISRVPKSVSNIIQRVYSEPFSFSVNPTPEFRMRGGIGIKLGTQPTPLQFIASGALFPQSISLSGGLESPLELKWLALENVVFQIDIDEVIVSSLAAAGIPIPFSGLGFRGGLSLGPAGDKRATVSIAQYVGISADTSISDFLMEGSAKNLRISDFVYYLSKLAKVPVPVGKMPSLTLDEVGLKVALSKVTIGQATYQPGIDVTSIISIAGARGSLFFRVDPFNFLMQGAGSISPIVTPYFVLTGPGRDKQYGTPDDGALLELLFLVKEPQKSHLTISGRLDFPTLNISQATNLTVGPTKIDAQFSTKIADLFMGDFRFGFEPEKPKNFILGFNVKPNVIPFLTKALKDESKDIKDKAVQKIAEIDNQVKALHGRLQSLRRSSQEGISGELKRTNEKVTRLKKEISVLKKEYGRKCKGLQAVKNAKRCITLTGLIAKKGTELAGLEIYRQGLLKPGKAVASVSGEITSVVNKIAQIEIARRTADKILDAEIKVAELVDKAANTIRLKEFGGLWSGEMAQKGISPKATLVVEMTLPTLGKRTLSVRDAEFNFKNPHRSIKAIVRTMIGSIKTFLKKPRS